MEQVVPLIATTGWAAGVNAYATVALLCVCQRADLVDLPSAFSRTDVLVVSLLLFAVEFVTDKVPLLDSAWDAIHTVIRPLIGGTVGGLIAGQEGAGALLETTAVGGSGVVALASHSAKASIRLAVNGSPEPFSNIALSLAEDLAVAGVVLLATKEPWIAAAVAAVLLASGVSISVWLAQRVRAGLRRLRERRRAARERPSRGRRPRR